MKKETVKTVVGWREFVDLPEWGIRKLRAKIDTGARSSALHVEDIIKLPNNKISFHVVFGKNKKKKITARPIHKGKVKSSIGMQTQRWYVETKLKIGPIERLIRINLVGREDMNFRMLIGRTAIEDDFLVDAAHGYLLKKKKVKKKASAKRKAKTRTSKRVKR